MLLVFVGLSVPAYAKASPLLFSREDPQHMLSKQYKAYVLARTFVPSTLQKYQRQLRDTDTPLPKSLRLFIDTNIDWNIYAKTMFGSHWNDLSVKQQKDFKILVRKVLLRKYGKHFSPDANFSVRFNRSTKYRSSVEKEFAKVTTLFISHARNTKFDIDFIFFKGTKRWAICDLHVDGVSHVQTYKSHVRRIYKKKGYPGVMKAFQRALNKS